MTNESIVIAVDAMGGDQGPAVVVPGAVEAATQAEVCVTLVGDEAKIITELRKLSFDQNLVKVVHASEVAEMYDKPSEVLRRKKDASIQVASRLVRDGKAHGLVSAGNSGATVACGIFILGRIPGVDRPALASVIPTEKEPCVVVDVGANVDCRPHNLLQFGLMGSALSKGILGVENPRIGLLSIGEEEGKGNSLVKEAYELFKMAGNIGFIGNAEGRDLFTGDFDVVVCDGFVGNVVLKLSEGLGSSFAHLLKREMLDSSLVAKVGSFLTRGAFKRFSRLLDYAEYGGAPLLGLSHIALVCHGASNAKAITSAVKMAATYIRNSTNQHIVASITATEELTDFSKASS